MKSQMNFLSKGFLINVCINFLKKKIIKKYVGNEYFSGNVYLLLLLDQQENYSSLSCHFLDLFPCHFLGGRLNLESRYVKSFLDYTCRYNQIFFNRIIFCNVLPLTVDKLKV